ncbi:MAG: efflux transporter outer membrane subunit [Rhodocyclaceae bacterium]
MGATLIAAALFLAGCATPLTHPGVEVALPTNWAEATAADGEALALEAEWWRRFDSGELETLIDLALTASPDLAVATERVVQAELAVRSTGASLFPAVNLNLATTGREANRSSAAGDSSSAGLAMSYEIDVWGSNLLALQGSRAQLAATRYDYEATRLSLLSGVVNAYTQVLAQRARIAIAQENLAIAERLFGIVEARYRNGAASALDVSRQRATVMSARDALLPLEAQERQNLRALAILTGQLPQGFDIQGVDLYALAVPELAPALPGELLARRPDLAAAEARLASADANIAVARAALFPLKLSVGLGSTLSSGEFGLLGLGSPTQVASLSLSLVQAIFDGGRLQAQVATTESARRQLVENYRATVLAALKEVDDALSGVERSRIQEGSQREIRDEYAEALRLSELRYREGSDSLSTLLDAQRSLFSAEDNLLQQRLTRLGATVDLYKALGGGWQRPDATENL